VASVPDSGNLATRGYINESHVPAKPLFIKNPNPKIQNPIEPIITLESTI